MRAFVKAIDQLLQRKKFKHALIVVNVPKDLDKKTLPLILIDYRGEFATSYSMLFTAIMFASIPMVLMYVFAQRSFIAGLTAGAVKG